MRNIISPYPKTYTKKVTRLAIALEVAGDFDRFKLRRMSEEVSWKMAGRAEAAHAEMKAKLCEEASLILASQKALQAAKSCSELRARNFLTNVMAALENCGLPIAENTKHFRKTLRNSEREAIILCLSLERLMKDRAGW